MKTTKKMVSYEVYGPFEVEVDDITVRGGRKRWWSQETRSNLRSRKGCYVFAIRDKNEFTPIYIGKTEGKFEYAVFSKWNIDNMSGVLGKHTGTLALYLVSAKGTKPLHHHIDGIETWLIQQAMKQNPNLLNIQKKKHWCIPGVVNCEEKPVSDSAKHLAKTLNLNCK